MASKKQAQDSNKPAVRKRLDSNMIFNPGTDIMPKGAATITGRARRMVDGAASAMPRDVAGSMPSNVMFPRVRAMADNLTPNPAEKMERTWHPGTVGRFVGNFGDKKTPHLISNPWKPTGLTGPGDTSTGA